MLFMVSYLGLGIPAIAAGVAVVKSGDLLATSSVYGAAVIALAAFATVNVTRLRTGDRAPTKPNEMIDTRSHKTPGPDHPISIATSLSHVVVRSGSSVIAETERALEMREASYATVYYIPIEDVDSGLLRRSDHHTYCPFKGDASYYDIIDGDGTELTAAVWSYAEPFAAVAVIRGHVAFYADRVTVTATPCEAAVR